MKAALGYLAALLIGALIVAVVVWTVGSQQMAGLVDSLNAERGRSRAAQAFSDSVDGVLRGVGLQLRVVEAEREQFRRQAAAAGVAHRQALVAEARADSAIAAATSARDTIAGLWGRVGATSARAAAAEDSAAALGAELRLADRRFELQRDSTRGVLAQRDTARAERDRWRRQFEATVESPGLKLWVFHVKWRPRFVQGYSVGIDDQTGKVYRGPGLTFSPVEISF